MKKDDLIFRSILLILMIFLLGGCGSQTAETPTLENQTSLPTVSVSINPAAEAWQEDLTFFSDSIKSIHPNPFKHLPEGEFDQMVQTLRNQLEKLSNDQIMVELMKITAALEDGHTFLTPLQELTGFQMYPLRLYLFEDGLYVIDAQAPYDEAVGQRVVSIGGMDVDEVLERLAPTISHDNPSTIELILPIRVLIPEMLQAMGIIDELDRPDLVLEDGEGAQTHLNPSPIQAADYREWIYPADRPGIEAVYDELTFLSGLPEQAEPLYLQKRNTENFWYEILEDGHTLYIQYNFVLSSSAESGSMGQFVSGLETVIATEDIEKIVVDLRHNPGGSNSTYRVLLNLLSNFTGKLYMITGRNTFSAAANFATEVEQATDAIFVGEAMGGSPNLFGDARLVRLPNSKLILMVSTRYWEMSTPDDARNTIEPDVVIPLYSDEFFRHVDPVLDFILGE